MPTTKQFPQTEDELKPILATAHISGDRLLDPWGRPYHFTFSKRSRYWDRVNVSTYYDYTAAKEKRVTEVTPVTQEMAFLAVSSYGPENQAEQAFNVAEFSRVLAEQSSKDLNKKPASTYTGTASVRFGGNHRGGHRSERCRGCECHSDSTFPEWPERNHNHG